MAFSSRLLKSLLGLFGYKFTRNIKHIFRKVYFPWRGSVCAQLFSVISIHCQALLRVFFNNFLESYPVDSSLYSQSGAKLRFPPPPKKKKGEGSEGTVLLRRLLVSVSPWVREGGGGGVSTAAHRPSVCLCMQNAWDIVTRSVKII